MATYDGRYFTITVRARVVAKFDAGDGGTLEIPDSIANYPDVSVQEVPSLAGVYVDQTGLSASEREALAEIFPVNVHHPDYASTLNQIEKAADRYGEYWVYRRLLGDTPADMPDPLETRASVPARDPNGTPTEQAVADWMDRYEQENSL